MDLRQRSRGVESSTPPPEAGGARDSRGRVTPPKSGGWRGSTEKPQISISLAFGHHTYVDFTHLDVNPPTSKLSFLCRILFERLPSFRQPIFAKVAVAAAGRKVTVPIMPFPSTTNDEIVGNR